MTYRIKQYAVSGPPPARDLDFLPPDQVEGRHRFYTLQEAVDDGRALHKAFGDAFAIWFRGRIVGTCDARGYVSREPGFDLRRGTDRKRGGS